MKKAIITTLALLMTAAVSSAEDLSSAINPVKPTFSWKKDLDNVPEERDPMTPTDFVWPRPAQGKSLARPRAKLVLVVEFISYSENDRFAKIAGISEFLEEGHEYSFTSKGQKVTFKVERIDPDKIVVNYEGQALEFLPKVIPEDLGGKKF